MNATQRIATRVTNPIIRFGNIPYQPVPKVEHVNLAWVALTNKFKNQQQ